MICCIAGAGQEELRKLTGFANVVCLLYFFKHPFRREEVLNTGSIGILTSHFLLLKGLSRLTSTGDVLTTKQCGYD